MRYKLSDAQIDGETIPARDLRALFPMKHFQKKTVVVHRDGLFRGNEREVLLEWAEELGSQFFLVEVTKKTPPRVYKSDSKGIERPEKGTLFKMNELEEIVISSPPPFGNATPQPLRLTTYAPFTIELAAHSVLSMTLMHHGSLLPPRLPITIHHSDRIAYPALRNIKPGQLEGNDQYWL